MSHGTKLLFKDRTGLTLLEVLVALLLLSVVFLAVSSLHVASQTLYFSSSDKAMVGYELQYAIQHIYEHVMTGIGDKNNQAIQVAGDGQSFTLNYIDKADGAQKSCSYALTGDGRLLFNSESLCPKVTLMAGSGFSMDGNVLRVALAAEFPLSRAGKQKEHLTLYSACYPRLASFN